MPTEAHFTPATFTFLSDLARNNSRPWFELNRPRWEGDVRRPAQGFVLDFGPRLAKISEHFRADPRPVGGSLFRIHRDVRFSNDKSPYKTHVGVHFRHFAATSAHAPGFYLHIEPGASFVGVGVWRPDADGLAKIRARIADDVDGWRKVVRARGFRARFELAGDALLRPPRGFDPEHPLIDDLKRKDFIAVAPIEDGALTKAGFLNDFASTCRAGAGLNQFLCGALGLGF